MDEQEYDLTVPVNKRDLIHALEAVKPKGETLNYYVVQIMGSGRDGREFDLTVSAKGLSSCKKPTTAKVIIKKPENRKTNNP